MDPIRKRLELGAFLMFLLAMAPTRFALNRAERAEIMQNIRLALAVFDRREKVLTATEIRVKSMLAALLSEMERHAQYDGGT